MNSAIEPQPAEAIASFDDEVRTSARHQARILRELGYRTDASHIERFVDHYAAGEREEPAA